METIKAFLQKERAYHADQARQNSCASSVPAGMRSTSCNSAWPRALRAQQAADRERLEKEAALAELERLKARLRAASDS